MTRIHGVEAEELRPIVTRDWYPTWQFNIVKRLITAQELFKMNDLSGVKSGMLIWHDLADLVYAQFNIPSPTGGDNLF